MPPARGVDKKKAMDSIFTRNTKSRFVTILDPSAFPSMARNLPGGDRAASRPAPRATRITRASRNAGARASALRAAAPGGPGILTRLSRSAAGAGATLGDHARDALRQGRLAALKGVSAAAGTLRAASASATASATATATAAAASAAIALPAAEPAWLLALDALPDLALSTARRLASLCLSTPRRRIGTAASFLAAAALGAALTLGAGYLADRFAFPLPAAGLLPDEGSAQELLMAVISPESGQDAAGKPGSLPPLPVMLQTRTYTVRSGDSIASVAKRFGVRQDTIISLNGLSTSKSFRSGVTLRIPNMDGVTHRVRKGESLLLIARRYGTDMTRLADANDLESASLRVGQNLFIPGARLSSSTLKNFYGETMVWPLRGIISSPFGYRSNPFSGARTFHAAIDVVARRGTPVKAAMDGKVADSGYNSVFGKYVIMSHSGGYQTLYAHLDEILVRSGQRIDQSATIGKSGNTGQSTGPHLHFSLFKNGKAIDPRSLLK